jgi:hypothetical protein
MRHIQNCCNYIREQGRGPSKPHTYPLYVAHINEASYLPVKDLPVAQTRTEALSVALSVALSEALMAVWCRQRAERGEEK